MNNTVKNVIRVAGVLMGLAAAAWALRDKVLPAPEVPTGPPPKFREPAGDRDTTATADLTTVKGIGPKTSEKLTSAGIGDLRALAGSEPTTVAEAADTSEATATRWIEAAGSLL